MKRATKYMMATAAATVMMLGSFSVSYAATGWASATVDKETVWYWYDSNGKMVKNDWVQSPASGLWYYFNSDGEMIHDTWGIDAKSDGYYFGADGAMSTGWRLISLDEDRDSYGPGSDTDEKGYFYFGTNGMVKEGWVNLDGTYYFLNDGYVDGFADYQMVYGEVEIDGEEYYFGTSGDGSMKKGMVKVITEENSNSPSSKKEESYYLYGNDGARVIGSWGKYNNEWYYVDDKGVIATEKFIAFDDDGDEVPVNDADAEDIYYMDKNGVMKKGWLELGVDRETRPGVMKGKAYYYFKDNGKMVTGWYKEEGKYYYFSLEKDDDYEKGQRVTGLLETEGNTYYFNANGIMVTSDWQQIRANDNKDYMVYFNNDGTMKKAKAGDYELIEIGSKEYFVNENGYRLEDGIIVVEGNKYVRYDSADEANKNGKLNKNGKYWLIGNSGKASKKTYK